MEPGKAGIGGTEFRRVLDVQGRQVSAGGEISTGAQRQEQVAENQRVERTGIGACGARCLNGTAPGIPAGPVLRKDNIKAGLKEILKDLVHEGFAKARPEAGA
ncbi:MAG: hypothetical protein NTW28_02095 [Candidatus Solibacter sp.]|nr:hypothetical protein [Candidatus Solibacter sp.]